MTVKERPIIFSAPMVRAILEGRKTQTRRLVKCPKKHNAKRFFAEIQDGGIADCPRGAPGDDLWVKETWGIPSPCRCGTCEPLNVKHVSYRADFTGEKFVDRWRPSIFMPRWASRITLEVVSVRVERLQEISDEDVLAEGIERPGHGYPVGLPLVPIHTFPVPRVAFTRLWDSLAKPGAEWASNPWVWVIDFKVGARE